MYIYKVNADNITCEVKEHEPENPIPNGWFLVPSYLEPEPLYIDNGQLMNLKPKSLVQIEQQAEENIQNELRKIAKDKIKTKKAKRITFKELFDNFEQREQEPHSGDELVELRKDVQMLKQMVAALLDNVVKENKD